MPVFTATQISFWNISVVSAEVPSSDVSDVQKKADKLQSQIEKAQKAKEALQKNLGIIQSTVSTTQKIINATKTAIVETDKTISQREQDIKNLDNQIILQQELLKSLVQQSYYVQNKPILSVILTEGNLADFFSGSQHLSSLDEKILKLVANINEKKIQVDGDKTELAKKKEAHLEVLATKTEQKQELVADQVEVQGDIQEKTKTISQLQGELNKLKSQYSAALGKSISTDDIVEAAKFAADETHINKSFLLGILVQESNKGQNVGGCNYKTSRMTSTQLVAFKKITKELGYDYTKQKVSCPSNDYKGTGGAMGVPQFMPTTWLGYKSIIASFSGHNPPDPWNLVDGVVAMAAKLSNDGADSKKRFDEAKSYCVYLAGKNWGYYCYGSASKYKNSYEDVNCSGSSIHNYGEKVLCLKDNYEKYY